MLMQHYIASTLNRLGYYSGSGKTWNETRVKNLRNYQIPVFVRGGDRSWVTMEETADILKTGVTVIRTMIRKQSLTGDYIQADETPLMVQVRGLGRNHRAYLWQYSRPEGAVMFDFQMGRGREGPRKFLGNYEGILQTDGYSAYDKVGGAKFIRAGC